MKHFYKNKTVLITGASSGIGRALALKLSEVGARLILSSEDETELLEVLKECKKTNNNVQHVIMDQSDPENIESAMKTIVSKPDRIDILILNAGISQRSETADTDPGVHNRIMQINFQSNVQIIHHLLPKMISGGGGHIAVTSSISGKFGFPLRSSYAASKHALHGFFETLGLEYFSRKIYVTLICPGRVNTNISRHALLGDGSKHGRRDAGQSGGISPDRCAIKYLRAIKNKRTEKLIGGKELLMVYIKRFFPRFFFKIAQKITPL